MKKIIPDYYFKNHHDLFDHFENGVLSPDQIRGFYIGNIMKYLTRYQYKNGLEDIMKANTYLVRLEEFERKHLDGGSDSINTNSKLSE